MPLPFWDGGQRNTSFPYSQPFQLWDGQTFDPIFKNLICFELLTLYQRGEVYELQLHSPLLSQEFLSHPVYSRLLEKKIGDTAVSAMKQAPSEGEALSVSFEPSLSNPD